MEQEQEQALPHFEERERIEIELLLEGVYRVYGFDFRDYALASLRRRIWNTIRAEGLPTVSALQERVLHEPACMGRFLRHIAVHVTSMFRDPSFYVVFRQKVVPLLRTYPFVRIWHAGCSTGEEVYSMAILLREEGLTDRYRIYATDMSEEVLEDARAGIFPLSRMQEYTANYLRAGGLRAFSDYYTAAYGGAIFSPALREHVIFSQHNLAMDSSFNEFHVILCRNVMIYFNTRLQERVHHLLYESLAMFGVLGLGSHETIKFNPHEGKYQALDSLERLYRRVA